ncbi:VPLPA-CTERM sorting domain-containing protein [Roseobacter ponti]|uniref:VPLPA-CTERM sorting domain-containing protein n=1 Tax=Roseobacter ponti TaxID=1891787 RepID=A0A858SUY2_9RHOB|nr:VPLPA-CTERM sorting domain-containing protein [Roseobacter ponti]QJF52495.1 VPLPA-CTERM sorting domain-containing protein [Roseobacter ponti]
MTRLITAAVTALLFGVSAASAATFTDRSLFDAAAGPGLALESFESVPLSGNTASGGLPSADFGDFFVSATRPAVKVIDTPFFFAQNTTAGGKNFLYLDSDIGFTGFIMTLAFDAPVLSFGFDYSGLGRNGDESTIFINGETMILPKATDAPAFFGFTSENGVSAFSINTNNNSAFSIDELAYGGGETATPVPLPAALPMLLVAVAGFGLMKRRKAA